MDAARVDAPPAKRPIRTHQVKVDGDTVFITLSTESPNLPPGVAAQEIDAETIVVETIVVEGIA